MSNTHNVWSKHFPNQLGQLAAEKREASTDLAKLQQMHAAIKAGIADLLAMRERCQPYEWDHAYAHLTDAGHYVEMLIKGNTDA